MTKAKNISKMERGLPFSQLFFVILRPEKIVSGKSLKLLLPNVMNHISVGALTQTLLRELTMLPDLYLDLRRPTSEGKKRMARKAERKGKEEGRIGIYHPLFSAQKMHCRKQKCQLNQSTAVSGSKDS